MITLLFTVNILHCNLVNAVDVGLLLVVDELNQFGANIWRSLVDSRACLGCIHVVCLFFPEVNHGSRNVHSGRSILIQSWLPQPRILLGS